MVEQIHHSGAPAFTTDGEYLMVANDHRQSLGKIIKPDNPLAVDAEQILDLKYRIIDSLYPQSSGLLVDPQYGIVAFDRFVDANPQLERKPLLMNIEESGYIPTANNERITQLGEHSVEQLQAMGADGVKLLVYFNPHAQTRGPQLAIAESVLSDCRDARLPFFLEVLTYNLDGQNRPKSELIAQSAITFLEAGVNPDVFKLEFPGDPAACQRVTDELYGIPWILLTAAGEYETFLNQLKAAVDNGAAGFLAGRSLWKEFVDYPQEDREKFFRGLVRERFSEVSAIVLGR